MAVYKIFPDKDSFIYTENVTGNAGYDEMLEVGGYPVSEIGQTSRILVNFNTVAIDDVITNKVGNSSYKANIKLALASAYELPVTHSIYAYPLYESWDGGTGKLADLPVDKSGVTWRYKKAGNTGHWTTPDNTVTMPDFVTCSYKSTFIGGGTWYTASNGFNVESIETFETSDDIDINIDVTTAIGLIQTGSLINNGFILKLEDELEFNTTSSIRLKYYSSNTNTIYPPSLEFKWDDSTYDSTGLPILGTDLNTIKLQNNKGYYVNSGVQRFRLHARPKYPPRTFTTSSIYKTNYALPQTTYWGIRDEFTEEMVVNFDTEFTKVSCDNSGSFFDVYMEGLQPERYYRLLVKSEIDGTTVVVNDNNVFKVVRNG